MDENQHDSPNNSKQGVLMLRHAGFLETMLPVVKRLVQVGFN